MNASVVAAWACLISTLLMTGVVFFVAVVHYPLFAKVGPTSFGAYHAGHTVRTTVVVMPLMLIEALSSAYLAVSPPMGVARWLCVLGFSAVVVCWLITFGISVPQHNRLASAGFDDRTHRALCVFHWVRTLVWALHAAIAGLILHAAIASGVSG